MSVILLATHNAHKVEELKALLSSDSELCHFEVVSLSDIGYHQDIIEDGDTFEKNALIKARVGAGLGYITVADDSGLEVDALDGAPGVYSARYSGEGATDASNNSLLIQNMAHIPSDKRTAQFVSVVACVFPDGRYFTVRGESQGLILTEGVGCGGFGYDPLFYQIEIKKTFAQASPEEKNFISHRGRAMVKFCEQIKSYL
ncbi:MAG: RdgB/HAM1 family non-canonical purine NTP pyrophosphatase [Clostridia bacterium]|nr:RdgB/HAM1 family non-canonical purine NTP pyrophosphatase [Clostridia bacterium]